MSDEKKPTALPYLLKNAENNGPAASLMRHQMDGIGEELAALVPLGTDQQREDALLTIMARLKLSPNSGAVDLKTLSPSGLLDFAYGVKGAEFHKRPVHKPQVIRRR